MSFIRNFAIAAITSTALVAPVFGQDAPTADTVLANVNGKDITLGHVIVLVDRLPEQYKQLEDKDLFRGILDQLVQQTVLSETVDTSSKELQLSRENEERALLATVAIGKIEDGAVSDEAVQKAYDEQYGNVEPEKEFNAAHILVESEEEAKELVTALEGGADFAELAKEKSTGPSGPNGGDLGWFGKGAMVPEFEEAVLGLEVGQVSAPVKTQFGWHVVMLKEIRDRPAPDLARVRGSLEDQLRNEAIGKRIEELEGQATITRNVEGFDPALIRRTDLIK